MHANDHIVRSQRDSLLDAFQKARGSCWERRADAFEWAVPRDDDYTGRATPEALEAQTKRLRAKADACRNHARLLAGEFE